MANITALKSTDIDPSRMPLGTDQQDCSLIASTFERGAHSTPTEAAVYATLGRLLQNKKQISNLASQAFSTYEVNSQVPTGGNAADLQGLNLSSNTTTSLGNNFGSKLLEMAKNCIPCDLRLLSKFQLKPNINLLGLFEAHIKDSLKALNDVVSLLNNADMYMDLCSLLKMLSFMCIPDLQRMIAILMAQFMLEATNLDGMIGILQALVAPLFAPLMNMITSLLDQFSQLVVGPLKCVIDLINVTLKSRALETSLYQNPGLNNQAATQVGGGLSQLNIMLLSSIATIERKTAFYMAQMKALLGELGAGDTAYLAAKLRVLNLVRMIAFIVAIILALSKGHSACDSTKTPEQDEMNNFFQNFLNPQTNANLFIDPNGQLQIDSGTPLPNIEDMLQLKGQPLINPELVKTIQQGLTTPTIKLPCKLTAPSSEEAAKLNHWIEELNNLGV